MDYLPPQEINTLYSQVRYIEEGDFPPPYKIQTIARLLDAELPEYVREFAYNNNCFFVMAEYSYSWNLYRHRDNVYSCSKKGKAQYINEHNKKLRFYKWYEKRKFHKEVFI